MFTGLENENRAEEFTLSVKIGRGTTSADVAEALRVIAGRIENEGTPKAGLLGYVDVGGEKKTAYWSFGKGVRD